MWDYATYGVVVLLTLAAFAAYGDDAMVGTADQVTAPSACTAWLCLHFSYANGALRSAGHGCSHAVRASQALGILPNKLISFYTTSVNTPCALPRRWGRRRCSWRTAPPSSRWHTRSSLRGSSAPPRPRCRPLARPRAASAMSHSLLLLVVADGPKGILLTALCSYPCKGAASAGLRCLPLPCYKLLCHGALYVSAL